MTRLKNIKSYNEMLQKKTELNSEIMKLTRHNDVLNQLEGTRKSLKATSDTVYHLRTEKNP